MRFGFSAILLFAAAWAGPSRASDCGAMASGGAALVGSQTTRTTPGNGPSGSTLDIAPGAHASIVETSANGDVSVIDYVGGELASRTDRATGRRVEFVESDVVGDIHSSAPGATSSYTVTIMRDGAEISRTRFERTVVGAPARKLSGCAFPVVRRTIAGVTRGTGKKVGSDSEFSLALGIPLWSRSTFETGNGVYVNETTVTKIALKR